MLYAVIAASLTVELHLLQLYADPYKGMITKEDGSEVEEDIYEAYNMSLVRMICTTCKTVAFKMTNMIASFDCFCSC